MADLYPVIPAKPVAPTAPGIGSQYIPVPLNATEKLVFGAHGVKDAYGNPIETGRGAATVEVQTANAENVKIVAARDTSALAAAKARNVLAAVEDELNALLALVERKKAHVDAAKKQVDVSNKAAFDAVAAKPFDPKNPTPVPGDVPVAKAGTVYPSGNVSADQEVIA